MNNNLSEKKQVICNAVLNQLLTLYPNCFSLENKKPLKIGIIKDLVKNHPEIKKNYISIVINNYVNTVDYQKTLVNYSHRVDLNGIEVEEITEKEKYRAAHFEERMAKRAEKSAAKQAKRQAELEELEQLRLQGHDIEKVIADRKAAAEQLKAERKATNKELCRLKKLRKKAHLREEKLRAEKKAAEELAKQLKAEQAEKPKPVQEPLKKPQVKKPKAEPSKKQPTEKEPVKIIIKPKRPTLASLKRDKE